MDSQSGSLQLQPAELYLLASILELPHLLGLEDPFSSLGIDEMDSELDRVSQTLLERGLLQPMLESSARPRAEVSALVRANSAARRTLVVTRALSDGSSCEMLVHRRAGVWVEQESLDDGTIRLSELTDNEAVIEHIGALFSPLKGPAAPGVSTTVSEQDWLEVLKSSAQGDRQVAEKALGRGGMSVLVAEALLETLAGERASGSLVTLIRDDLQMRYGESVAWLVGPRGAWMVESIRQGGRAVVRLVPMESDAIHERWRALVESAGTIDVPGAGQIR